MIVKFNLFEKQLSLFNFPKTDKDLVHDVISNYKTKPVIETKNDLSFELNKLTSPDRMNNLIYTYLLEESELDSADFFDILYKNQEILFDYIRENPDNIQIGDEEIGETLNDKCERLIDYIKDDDDWCNHIENYIKISDKFKLYLLEQVKGDLYKSYYDTEAFDDLKRTIYNSDDPKRLQIFRSITLNELSGDDFDLEDYNGIGIYWSYDFDGAKAHNGHRGISNREFILEGWVYSDGINWEGTIYKSIYSLRDEKEIELNQNTPIEIEHIYMKSLHSSLLNDDKEFKQIKKMFNLKDDYIYQHLYDKWRKLSRIEFDEPYWVKA